MVRMRRGRNGIRIVVAELELLFALIVLFTDEAHFYEVSLSFIFVLAPLLFGAVGPVVEC